MEQHDWLATIQLNDTEKCQILALLNEAERQTSPYNGSWTAAWLYGPIHASTWWVSKGEGTRLVDGELVGARKVDWGFTLPDGSRMTDDANRPLMETLQKAAFLGREAAAGHNVMNSETHEGFVRFNQTLARWVNLNKNIFIPERDLLTRIDGTAVRDFFTAMAQGGISILLQYPQRLLSVLYMKAHGKLPPDELLQKPFSIPASDRAIIGQWFSDNGYVTTNNRGTPILNRGMIADLLGVDLGNIGASAKFLAFLQTITPGGDPALMTGHIFGEYPGHRVPLLKEAINSKSTSKFLLEYQYHWSTFFSLHRHLPDALPSPREFSPKKIKALIKDISDPSEHTPWVPLKTALTYTTESLRWVHLYGNDLVTFFLKTYRHFYDNGLFKWEKGCDAKRRISEMRDQYVRDNLPQPLKALNISSWSRSTITSRGRGKGRDSVFAHIRSAPSLNDVMMILMGAIVTIVGITKPFRESEIRALGMDCVLFVEGDGYWVEQGQGKKNVEDVRAREAKPIPGIASRALLLLRQLSEGVKQAIGMKDEWLLQKLFVLPDFGRSPTNVSHAREAELARFLDAFCDYVALPPDKHGRRWYLRVHEMRKSFLITFFWCYRYASLDAGRWIAGHRDASHLYEYIQDNFPGKELPELEAQYVTKQLFDFEAYRERGEIENIESLYNLVCKHFGVTALSLVGEIDLHDWLELQFAKRKLVLRPYSIRSDDGSIAGTLVAVKFAKDEG